MHGYLGIAISDAEYSSKFGTAFTPYIYPGPLPEYPQNATQHQIAAIKDLHNWETKLFNKQRGVVQALRNLTIQAIEEPFIKPMREEFVGYNNRSIPEIFTYLFSTFGTITYQDLNKNKEDMKKS